VSRAPAYGDVSRMLHPEAITDAAPIRFLPRGANCVEIRARVVRRDVERETGFGKEGGGGVRAPGVLSVRVDVRVEEEVLGAASEPSEHRKWVREARGAAHVHEKNVVRTQL